MRISDWSSDVCSSDLPRAPGESNGKFFVKYEKLACPVRSANNRGFRLGGHRKVDWGWIVWGLDAAVHEALLFAAVGFLVGGIDDLAIDAIFLVRIAWRRASVMRGYRDRQCVGQGKSVSVL